MSTANLNSGCCRCQHEKEPEVSAPSGGTSTRDRCGLQTGNEDRHPESGDQDKGSGEPSQHVVAEPVDCQTEERRAHAVSEQEAEENNTISPPYGMRWRTLHDSQHPDRIPRNCTSAQKYRGYRKRRRSGCALTASLTPSHTG